MQLRLKCSSNNRIVPDALARSQLIFSTVLQRKLREVIQQRSEGREKGRGRFYIDTRQCVGVCSIEELRARRSILSRYIETKGDEWRGRSRNVRLLSSPRMAAYRVHEHRNFLLTGEQARIRETAGNL